ncbi:MAG TPA: hypothetical protein VFT45_08825 [Longimicrobium sp.]|nr:hypothetical protein [Longimicrobium sp.]
MSIPPWTRRVARAFVPVLFLSGGRLAGQEAAEPYLQSVRANAVRVRAGAATGFGFIVGLGERTLLIATAEHTLDNANGPPQVCFMERPDPCAEGKVVYVDDPRAPGDPDLDLALIEVGYPDRLPWRPDVMGAAPMTGQPAWFIGRNEEWYVPPVPGRIVASDPRAGSVRYTGLSVAQGVSGAPILVPGGIVGMHRESAGDDASEGVLLSVIRNRVEERLGRQWILVPRRACGAQGAQAGILANRWVIVRFSWRRAAPAMEAMARLRCAGALPLPSPLWESAGGEREIVYRNGDLRSARLLQTLLTPLGRIETRIGTPEGELEIVLP